MFDLTRRATLAGAAAVLPLVAARASTQPPFAEIEQKSGGTLHVAALDTGSGRRLGYREHERALMCSTFKFMLVAKVLSLADSHKEAIDRRVKYTSADLLDWAPVTRAHMAEGAMTLGDLAPPRCSTATTRPPTCCCVSSAGRRCSRPMHGRSATI